MAPNCPEWAHCRVAHHIYQTGRLSRKGSGDKHALAGHADSFKTSRDRSLGSPHD